MAIQNEIVIDYDPTINDMYLRITELIKAKAELVRNQHHSFPGLPLNKEFNSEHHDVVCKAVIQNLDNEIKTLAKTILEELYREAI